MPQASTLNYFYISSETATIIKECLSPAGMYNGRERRYLISWFVTRAAVAFHFVLFKAFV
jgi:hypothetical protein